MKKKDMKQVLDALKTIKLPKFEDKELRNAIIKDHFKLLGENKKYEEAIDNLRTAHLGALADEQKKVNELREELRTVTKAERAGEILKEIREYQGYLDAEADFIKDFNELAEEEVEITPIDSEKFLDEIQKQDFDLGLIEAIYPMFNL